MSKKSSGRSQSSSLSRDDLKDGLVIGIGEAVKKKRTSDSDHSEGDQKHKKRKCDEEIKKKSSHSDEREKSHKAKKGKKKSRHHRKTPTKNESSSSKSKDSTPSSHDKSKKHSPDSKHSSKDTLKDSSKSKPRSDPDKGSKLAKMRAKFQGRQTFNSRSSTFSPTLTFKKEDLETTASLVPISEQAQQKTRNLKRVKRKRRMYIEMKNAKSSKYVRFKLLQPKRRKPCEFIRETSPSLSKPQCVDPDLIGQIGMSLDPELQLENDVKLYLADDVTIRIREIIENASDLIKHSGRKTLRSCDIDEVLTDGNFGRIFGPLQSFYCTNRGKYYYDNPDMGVHLGNEANKMLEIKQPGVPYVKQQWYQTEEMTSINNDYFTSICKCIFSHNERLATLALNNLKSTRKLNSQLVDQFASFCFYTYNSDPTQRGFILILIRILATNPSAALIQPNAGMKLLSILLVTELFPKKGESTDDTLHFEISETLCSLIQCWKPLEFEILTQIEKCLNTHPTITIPEGVLRVTCTHGIEITKLLFWDRLRLNDGHNTENSILPKIKVEPDEEKQWIIELHRNLNDFEATQNAIEIMEVDYDLRQRLLFASRFVYASLSFTCEWSKEISVLLGDSLVPFFPQKDLGVPIPPSNSLHTIYKGVQLKRISRKIETVSHSVYGHFEDYKYLMPRSVILNYGLPQLVNNRKSLYLTRDLRGRVGTEVRGTKIVNIDIRKLNTFPKERKLDICTSHSLFMSL